MRGKVRSRGRAAVGGLAQLAMVTAIALLGCGTTHQAKEPAKPSGFLGDYSALLPGEGDEAQLVFIDSRADFASYESIIIESVTIWRSSSTANIPEQERTEVINALQAALYTELSKDFSIVQRAGPGVLRVRAAVTDATGANLAGPTSATALPESRLLSAAGDLASGNRSLVVSTGIEGEVTDSVTHQRLVAAVDRRVGSSTLRSSGDWDLLRKDFDFWAGRLRERLVALRSR